MGHRTSTSTSLALLATATAVFFLVSMPAAASADILTDYEECKNANKFGTEGAVICDPEKSLRPSTVDQLSNLLNQLKTKVKCNCESGCYRGAGLTDEFVGLLIVTKSEKVNATGEPLADSAQKIYEGALLGNETCDNGILIVYVEDEQRLATYRGGGNFLLLTDTDEDRLHKIAVKGNFQEKDKSALQYLLTNYDSLVERQQVHVSESWTPFIGLIIALFLILFILALLAALLLSRLCCCCREKTHSKDTYYVTPVTGTYKSSAEPVYIVTAPPESIYTSPYPPSPLALPPPPPPPLPHHGTASLPVTPNSAVRHKVVSPSGKSPDSNTTTSAVTRSLSAGSRLRHGTVSPTSKPGSPLPVGDAPPGGVNPAAAGGLEPGPDGSLDLPFLDPHRKREIQTREDYIY